MIIIKIGVRLNVVCFLFKGLLPYLSKWKGHLFYDTFADEFCLNWKTEKLWGREG